MSCHRCQKYWWICHKFSGYVKFQLFLKSHQYLMHAKNLELAKTLILQTWKIAPILRGNQFEFRRNWRSHKITKPLLEVPPKISVPLLFHETFYAKKNCNLRKKILWNCKGIWFYTRIQKDLSLIVINRKTSTNSHDAMIIQSNFFCKPMFFSWRFSGNETSLIESFVTWTLQHEKRVKNYNCPTIA